MLSFYLSIIEDEKSTSKFEALYHTYEKMLFKIACSITRNHHDAEDATQIAWFSIAKEINVIDTENTDMLKSYLYTVIKNSSIDIIVKRKNLQAVIDIDGLLNICSEENAINNLESDEQYQVVLNKISALPNIYKDILFLYYVLGLSTKEISESLNKNRSTVKSRLLRGNKILRKILAEVDVNEQQSNSNN